MWVDTKGEDGPQCIHHTPVGALMAQQPPSRSCRSLQYALQNTLNTTDIRIKCGTHELRPYDVPASKPFPAGVFALRIEGECVTSRPTVRCLNRAVVAFNGIANVILEEIDFEDCGNQEEPTLVDSFPTLYFSKCTDVRLQHITVHITGQCGSGISLKEVISYGVIALNDVSVLHNGTHGNGILCDIHGTYQLSVNRLSLYMNNVQVVNTNTHTEYDPSMSFTGVRIIAQGIGLHNKISLHNTTVFNSAPASGYGILVSLLEDMHWSFIQLARILVLDGWDNRYQTRNRTDVLTECDSRQLEMIKEYNNTVHKIYAAVAVFVKTSNNTINITNAELVSTYGPMKIVAMSVIFEKLAALNRVYLTNVLLSSKGISHINRLGLFVKFVSRTSENTVVTQNVQVVNSTTKLGRGVYLLFSGQCSSNTVELNSNSIVNHVSKGGGTLVAYFEDYAHNNTIYLHRTILMNNTATLGGGLRIILGGLTIGNVVKTEFSLIYGNRASAGGGVYIKFTNSSERNIVFLWGNFIMYNTLGSTPNVSMMGGGIHVEMEANRAMVATKNVVMLNLSLFVHNKAKGGVGGGLSLLYVHSPYTGDRGDEVHLKDSILINNQADYGHAFAVQSSPHYHKALFRGITSINTLCYYTKIEFLAYLTSLKDIVQHFGDATITSTEDNILKMAIAIVRTAQDVVKTIFELKKKQANPFFQIQANTSLILLISVQIQFHGYGMYVCGAASQGILAVDSEIILQPYSWTYFTNCVASHGGAMALYGESYIRVSTQSILWLTSNHAFQRGGAIYVHSTTHAVPRVRCFLQHQHGQKMELDNYGIVFQKNSAKHEGQSVYKSEAENCFGSNLKLIFLEPLHFNITNFDIQKMYRLAKVLLSNYSSNITHLKDISTHNASIDALPQVVSSPDHVDGRPVDLDNPFTVKFIPGKQKQLPHKHAYDKLGNAVNTVFTVQIITEELTTNVHLNPFSKYTADFTVILHGIPLTHGMANLSITNESNTTANATPQLVLQSVDNTNLLLIVNIELQCCPPGYIYRIGSGDKGTCHCGILTLLGIEDCNETDPNNIGAVLPGNHWVGYLPSNDQHSCDGQMLFSAPCPAGYCQTHRTTLPTNNSKLLLENAVCGGSKRKGLLCGDCLEGSGIAVNFNGMRPVCISCQDGLSTVGLLVWILSEWVPMLVVMFIVMLFNIDLVSGRFNSFLLFAQLLAFSSIRGDAELGTVHIAFVKIYRFLYGMWNLDFFGVLLPPYCLIPHSHLTLLQTLLLHYSIGLFPLIVAITLIVLERSAEKWICCHRVDQCLRRMRRWKAKYSDGMSYDRALPAFVILGFTRFLVSSSYILVNQTITGEDGEERMVVWWQGSVPYGSIEHIAYFIPAIIILLVFVLLPAFLLLTLPIVPQLFGRLIIAVPPLRKLQRMQTFCSNVYTDRWIYHFVNVFQGCYKEHLRSFSSLYLIYRIIQLLAAVFVPNSEDALWIQLVLTLVLQLLIVVFQPYTIARLNNLDTAILGNMSLILVLSLRISSANSQTGVKQFFASVRMILIYLPLLYPGIIFGKKVYMKCPKLRCCHKRRENEEDDVEPLMVDPTEGLGNFVRITELRAGAPTSSDEESETETQSEEIVLENQNTESVVVDLAV